MWPLIIIKPATEPQVLGTRCWRARFDVLIMLIIVRVRRVNAGVRVSYIEGIIMLLCSCLPHAFPFTVVFNFKMALRSLHWISCPRQCTYRSSLDLRVQYCTTAACYVTELHVRYCTVCRLHVMLRYRTAVWHVHIHVEYNIMSLYIYTRIVVNLHVHHLRSKFTTSTITTVLMMRMWTF